MKIVLVGYTGFVGSSILNSPLLAQHEFICLGRSELSKSEFPEKFYSADVLIYTVGVAHDIAGDIPDNIYYTVNVDLLKKVYNEYSKSSIKTFIYFSSIKVVADKASQAISESTVTNPQTIYGKTKLLAEQYILDSIIPSRRFYVLRPSMIHGPNNRGNLNTLFQYLAKGTPWIFNNFDNKRSFSSIKNVIFIINELLTNLKIESGIYNICDDEIISTNSIVEIYELVTKKKVLRINIPKIIIILIFKLNSRLGIKFNTLFLEKIVGNFVIDNSKIKKAVNKKFPVNAREGLITTFESFLLD